MKFRIRSSGSLVVVPDLPTAPSDFPDFAQFLVREGIDSISLIPDTVIKTTAKIAQAER